MNSGVKYFSVQEAKDQKLIDAVWADDIIAVKNALDLGADAKTRDSEALRRVAQFGDVAIAEILIPLSDPKAGNSSALCYAVAHGHNKIVDLLYPVSDVDYVLTRLGDDSDLVGGRGINYLRAKRENEILQQSTTQAAGAWSPDPKEADAQFERRVAEAQAQGVEPHRQQASARIRL